MIIDYINLTLTLNQVCLKVHMHPLYKLLLFIIINYYYYNFMDDSTKA